MMDLQARLRELARLGGTPVVSVYLNTRWRDEHHRDRVRVYLEQALARARAAPGGEALTEDLDWVEREGQALIAQSRYPDASGVALFASRALGLREVLPLAVPFEDAFVVADQPYLRPLAALAGEVPSALVVHVEARRARLIPLDAAGAGEVVALESDVPGQHRRGGWAQLAQSRYQRHIQAHRAQHFQAVAEALRALVEERGVQVLVLAGAARTVAAFRPHLPASLAARVAGRVAGARHEAPPVLAGRAFGVLARHRAEHLRATVEQVLTEAARGGAAVAGPEETLEAVSRGAVHRLYLLRAFEEAGGRCGACGRLQRADEGRCRACGGVTRRVELGEAMVNRVIATGGSVELVEAHPGLTGVGGVAARLRYAL